jgi:hypothetical protein
LTIGREASPGSPSPSLFLSASGCAGPGSPAGSATASPGGLWAAITSGTGLGTIAATDPLGGDRALFSLAELFDHFAATDQLGLLRLIIRIAGNEARPENAFALARLRYGV